MAMAVPIGMAVLLLRRTQSPFAEVCPEAEAGVGVEAGGEMVAPRRVAVFEGRF